MPFSQRQVVTWQLRSRSLTLGARTLVLGIVNVTPDSFSGDGLGELPVEGIVRAAVAKLDAGADMLDLGAESTRPGATPISSALELRRLLPVVKGVLRERPKAILSIDTYHADTALAVADAGAEIINDVSGLHWDEAMARSVASSGCAVVLTHTRGRPSEWRNLPTLVPAEVLPQITSGLHACLRTATEAGMSPDRVVLDPGFGFGKRGGANFTLLAHLAACLSAGRPLLVGVSRKSFLGEAVAHLQPEGLPVPLARMNATLSAQAIAVVNGASVLRVHDVASAREAVAVADAVLAAVMPTNPAG